jgi:membrane AbrB-like protein
MRAVQFWALVVLAYAAVVAVLLLLEAPSAFLFAGVLAGACVALKTSDARGLPVWCQRFGMATVGVAAGSQIDADVLELVVQRPATILGSVCATIIVTLLCGQLLRLSPHISPITALFASIAGGASGVTVVVREIGGDDAVVMAIQYLRVVAVLITIPVAAKAFGATNESSPASTSSPASWSGLGFTVVCLVVGLVLAHFMSFSASRLIVPLLVAVGLSVGEVFDSATVPPSILAAGFASIGLMVGLAVTISTLRVLLRVLPLAALQLILVLGSSVVTGLVLARLTGISRLDGYLASTPGGLPAVTAIAIGSGASVGVVITVQLMRLFVALALAAALGEWFTRRSSRLDVERDDEPL